MLNHVTLSANSVGHSWHRLAKTVRQSANVSEAIPSVTIIHQVDLWSSLVSDV